VATLSLETHSDDETRALGEALGRAIDRPLAIALIGPLGAGKTCLVQGLAVGLGVARDRRVGSPTFTLVNEHAGRLRLCHADLYRIELERELDELGLEEYLADGGVVVAEWADRFPQVLPDERLEIVLHVGPGSSRRLDFVARGQDAKTVLARLG
jgi:tRNA threonylcarbamoyladenosine biosynthesis protein TsaE